MRGHRLKNLLLLSCFSHVRLCSVSKIDWDLLIPTIFIIYPTFFCLLCADHIVGTRNINMNKTKKSRKRKIKITRLIKWYFQFIMSIGTVSKLGAFKFKTNMNVKAITLQDCLGSEIVETILFLQQLVSTMGVSRWPVID